MSLKDNIVEKIYSFLEQIDASLDFDNNSEDILLKKHHNELTINNLISEMRPKEIEKLREGVVKSKVSEQKYLLQMIMSFLFTNLGDQIRQKIGWSFL